MTERRAEQIPLSDGSALQLTIAEPESVPRGGVIRGGIVVFPEAHGVTAAVCRLAGVLAGEGWLAVVPHLYHRDGVDELPGDSAADQVRGYLERLSVASVLADTDASFGWLAGRGVPADRTGAVGFGLGGALALIVATQRTFGASVTLAGVGVGAPVSPALPALVEAAPALRCPWLGIYGAHDLPDGEVHELQQAVHSARVATDLVYFAGSTHPFGADQPAAVETWTRMLNWFDSHLR